jgi:hypothetical protein
VRFFCGWGGVWGIYFLCYGVQHCGRRLKISGIFSGHRYRHEVHPDRESRVCARFFRA